MITKKEAEALADQIIGRCVTSGKSHAVMMNPRKEITIRAVGSYLAPDKNTDVVGVYDSTADYQWIYDDILDAVARIEAAASVRRFICITCLRNKPVVGRKMTSSGNYACAECAKPPRSKKQ